MKKILLFTLCAIGSFVIKAQTEFTANEDNNWNNPENWTNGMPSAGNDAVIPEGLTANNEGSIVADYTIQVNGVFNNNGDFSNTLGSGLFIGWPGGQFNNYGSLNFGIGMLNFGLAYLGGDVVVDETAVIINVGTLCTDGSYTNNGESQIEGIWHNTGELINNGEFLNAGYLFDCGVWTGLDVSDAWVGQDVYYSCDELPGCSELMTYIEPGCTDETACNYDPLATVDDNSCLPDLDEDGICDDCDTWQTIIAECPCEIIDPNTYLVTFIEVDEVECVIIENCSCECINDADQDGICDENEVEGCTDPDSCNYSAEATEDDGSCSYLELYSITGEVYPTLSATATYTYPETEESSYDWTCTGGIIQSGNGTGQIETLWDQQIESGEVCVTETNAEQCSSELVCIDVFPLPMGVLENEMINLTVFPNPASAGFTITLNENLTNASYRLHDISGKLVREGEINTTETNIQTEGLITGNYALTVTARNLLLKENIILK